MTATLADSNGDISGNISGSGTFTKNGAGTLALSGTNTFTGTTTVSSGRLNVNGSITSNVSVDSILGGTGTITGNVTLNPAGDSINPGVNEGRLTVNGNVLFDSTGDFDIDLSGTTAGTNHDQLRVNGAGRTIALNGSLLDVNLGAFTPAVNDTFTIIDVTNAGVSVTGTFVADIGGTIFNLPEGEAFLIGAEVFTISYIGGTGNDVVLKAHGTAETFVRISGTDLEIEDINGGNSNDTISVQSDSANSRYIIFDPNNTVTTGIPGATRPTPNQVFVPFSAISGTTNILVDTLAGNDNLTVDFSFGNFSRTIDFQGGNPIVATGDSLTLIGGGTFTTATFTYTNASSGAVAITGNSLISYSGLEPISSLINAQNVVLQFNTTSDTISLADSGTAGRTRVTSDNGETTTFKNPTTQLTLNAGLGNDAISVTGLGSGFNANLTIDGEGGSDTVSFSGAINLMSKDLLVTSDAITISQSISAGNVSLQSSNGVALTGANADLSVTGTFTVDADTDDSGTGNFVLDNAGSSVTVSNTAANPDASITAADIDLQGTLNVGAGSILILSSDDSAIRVGTSNAADFSIDDSELDGITANTLTVGGATTTGFTVDNVSATGTANIANLVLDATRTGTAVSFANNASTLANGVNLTINSDNGGVAVNAALTLGQGGATPQGTGALAIVANTGGVAFASNTTAGSGGINVSSPTTISNVGTLRTSGLVSLTADASIDSDATIRTDDGVAQSITLTANAGAGTIDLGGNLQTRAGAINVVGSSTLTSTISVNTTNGTATGANINLAAVTSLAGQGLTLHAGTGGDITISGRIGATSLGLVTIADADDINFSSATNPAQLNGLTVTNSSTFTSASQLNSTAGINVTADDAGATGTAVTLAGGADLNGNDLIFTVGADVVIGGPVISTGATLGEIVAFRGVTNATTFSFGSVGGANVDVSETSLQRINNTIGKIQFGNAGAQTGAITIDDGAADDLLTINTALTIFADGATGQTNLNSSLTTNGDVIVDGADNGLNINGAGGGTVTITSNGGRVEINDNLKFVGSGDDLALATAGGNVDLLGSAIANTTAARGENVTITAGAGNVTIGQNAADTFGGSVADTNRLGDVRVVSATNVIVNANVGAGRFIQDSAASNNTTTINGTLNLDNGAAGDVLDLDNVPNVVFSNGANVTTGTSGNVNLDGTTTGTLTINAANFNLDGSFAESDFTSVTIAGDIVTTGDAITFNDAVTLDDDVQMTGSAVTFENTLDATTAGDEGLTITGGAVFRAAVGSGQDLEFLSVSAATTLSAGTVETTGDQTYSGAVTLTADTTLTGNDISFGSTLNGDGSGPWSLVVTSTGSGVTTFTGAVGGTNALSFITTNADGRTVIGHNINVNSATATTFNDAVLLSGNSVISQAGTGAITFNSTVDSAAAGNFNLTVNTTTGATIFNGAVGSDALGALSHDNGLGAVTTNATGTTQINGGSVRSTGNQTYNDIVTIAADTILTGAAILFATTVDSATATRRALTVNSSGSGATTFNGAVGSNNRLASVTTNADGTTFINNGTINVDGSTATSFGDAVVFSVALTVDQDGSGHVQFGGTLNSDAGNNRSLQLNLTTGTADFVAAVGANDALSAIDVTNAGTAQFGASARVTGNIKLTADEIDFNGGASTISTTGVGTILLQATTAAVTIGIGGGAGTLDLSVTDVSALADGFSEINVGYEATGTAAVDIDGGVFKDDLHVTGGSISVTGLGSVGSRVTLLARTGGVSDGGSAATDVTAGSLKIDAQTGVGSADKLETAVDQVAVVNAASGNIFIDNTSATLTIGTVDGTSGVTLSGTGGSLRVGNTGAVVV
ncbi:MAG: autotransporter-associated beta strand repeat-containing protein, partial [Planctomycetota bacterium]|nr:autotransporter-associated beta strand repeat-containing protein [Planctomycetota bacterium]